LGRGRDVGAGAGPAVHVALVIALTLQADIVTLQGTYIGDQLEPAVLDGDPGFEVFLGPATRLVALVADPADLVLQKADAPAQLVVLVPGPARLSLCHEDVCEQPDDHQRLPQSVSASA
jgi:hypothetical protein